MDPNETLRRLRDLMRTAETQRHELSPYEVADIVDHFEDLDDWLSKGGCPPEAWLHYED